jgi:Ca2+-dependent lipid-binding protein
MTPAWADEVIEVDVKYIGDDIHFAVMDDEDMADESIGSCVVKISSFISNEGKMDDWWEIQYEGKSAGHLHMKSFWTASSEALKEAPKPEEIKI